MNKEQEKTIGKNVAICKQFPFLEKYDPFNRYARPIKISRFNDTTLKMASKVVCNDHGSSAIYVMLLDKNGEQLEMVGFRERHKRQFALWNPLTWFRIAKIENETVEKAIVRMAERANLVHYVLEVDYTTIPDVTLFKSPKGMTIAEYAWKSALV